MKDATDFVKRYENVDDFTVYGMNNFVSQFIAQKIQKKLNLIVKIYLLQQLISSVNQIFGFPEPHLAEWAITAITIKNSKEKVYRMGFW